MKTFLTQMTWALLLVAAGNTARGQAQDEILPGIPVFGIGLQGEQLRGYDLISRSFVPVNKIVFTLSPGSRWRLESTFGFSKLKDRLEETGISEVQTLSGLFFGLGGFGMYQAGRANLYYGIRLGYGLIKEEVSYAEDGGYSYRYTAQTNRFTFAPVLGAEYFIGNRFSIGGEVALKSYRNKITETSSDNPDPAGTQTSNFFSTETGFLLRFYF